MHVCVCRTHCTRMQLAVDTANFDIPLFIAIKTHSLPHIQTSTLFETQLVLISVLQNFSYVVLLFLKNRLRVFEFGI